MSDFIYNGSIVEMLLECFPETKELTEENINKEIKEFCKAVEEIAPIINKFSDKEIIYFSLNVLLNFSDDQQSKSMSDHMLSMLGIAIKNYIELKDKKIN